jgi:hypothetical protein
MGKHTVHVVRRGPATPPYWALCGLNVHGLLEPFQPPGLPVCKRCRTELEHQRQNASVTRPTRPSVPLDHGVFAFHDVAHLSAVASDGGQAYSLCGRLYLNVTMVDSYPLDASVCLACERQRGAR